MCCIDTAVEATRIGAYDFLKTDCAAKLLATVGRAAQRQATVKPR
jgi:DNA-binding NtrC family response regulator